MGITLNPTTLLNGTGLDISSLISQIQSNESGELQVWEQQQSDLSTQAGLLQSINTDLNSLQTAVQALNNVTGPLAAMDASSSAPNILSATADTSAVAGNHEIVVSNLATTGTVYTDPMANGDTSFLPSGATGGDIHLQVGGATGTVDDIPITPGVNDTLSTLASYIDQQNWGVTANVVTDANGARLAIYSQSTGTPGALAITSNTITGTLNTADLTSADTSILPSGEGSGDIQLQVGGTNGTIDDIPITAGSNDTLNTLASYINQQSSQNNWGVTASVVSDANGYHLSLASQAQGPAGDLAFTNNTTILSTVPNPATNLSFEAPFGGTDASLTIDGVPFDSHSNTLTGDIPGVTLNLASADPNTPVQLTVAPDITQATDAINTFVSAYNTVVGDINQQFTVDPTTNSEGPLGSDTGLRSLQSSLLNDVTYSISGSNGPVNLASFGINMNKDGTLTVGTTPSGQSLSDAIAANPAAFQNFFQNASQTGFANAFNNDLTNLTDPTEGVLNADIAENTTQQQSLTTQISDFETQLSAQQTQLTAQFSAVNASLQAYPSLLNAVTTLLAGLEPSTSNSTTSGG
jgi:flagellar hook-associated protein 2